jgi:hypothetical protein
MLSDIIKYASEITNIRDTTPQEHDQLLLYINRAAREIYHTWDLPHSLWERYFCIDTADQLITLPWYVDEIRGIRRATFSSKIQLVDMRPRYHYRPWRQPTLQWRLMSESALERTITQAGRLVVSLAGMEDVSLTVTIVGQTTTSGLTRENLIFEPGVTQLTTTNQYTQDTPNGIKSITKSAASAYDLIVTQELDGLQIASIANFNRIAKNQCIQVHDGNYSLIFAPTECSEILFKWPYKPLVEDSDLFIGTERFDDVIVWKIREHWHSTRPEEGGLALACSQKCLTLIQKLSENIESSAEKQVQYAEDGLERAPLYRYRWARYGQIQ